MVETEYLVSKHNNIIITTLIKNLPAIILTFTPLINIIITKLIKYYITVYLCLHVLVSYYYLKN